MRTEPLRQLLRGRSFWIEGVGLLAATPFLLFPTKFIMGTAVALSLIVVILSLSLFVRRRPLLPTTPSNILILILAFSIGISVLVTADPDKTFPQFTRLIASLIIFYTVILVINRRHQTWIWYGLIILGTLLAFIAPASVAWNKTKGALIPEAVYNLFPTLTIDTIHPNIMASLMILLLPIPLAFGLRVVKRPDRFRWLWWGISGWMGFILLLTKSRGGYLAIFVGMLVMLWLLRRRWMMVSMVCVTFFIGIWFLQISNIEVPNPDAGISQDITDPSTLEFRLEVWRVALWMVNDFPFTGVGMGAFNNVAVRLYPFAENSNPGTHNIFLQVGSDLGYPGLIIYIALLIQTFGMGWLTLKHARQIGDLELQAMMSGVLGGVVGYSMHGLVDNGLWSTQVSFVPWIIIAFIVGIHMLIRSNDLK